MEYVALCDVVEISTDYFKMWLIPSWEDGLGAKSSYWTDFILKWMAEKLDFWGTF